MALCRFSHHLATSQSHDVHSQQWCNTTPISVHNAALAQPQPSSTKIASQKDHICTQTSTKGRVKRYTLLFPVTNFLRPKNASGTFPIESAKKQTRGEGGVQNNHIITKNKSKKKQQPQQQHQKKFTKRNAVSITGRIRAP